MSEVQFSKIKDEFYKEKLCPIKFYLPAGLLVVMPKVDVLNENELLHTKELKRFCTSPKGFILPAELKNDSFGFFKGKLVCIDYGDHRYIKD